MSVDVVGRCGCIGWAAEVRYSFERTRIIQQEAFLDLVLSMLPLPSVFFGVELKQNVG